MVNIKNLLKLSNYENIFSILEFSGKLGEKEGV